MRIVFPPEALGVSSKGEVQKENHYPLDIIITYSLRWQLVPLLRVRWAHGRENKIRS